MTQGLNRYSYVVYNPVRFNDPTGHKWDDCSNVKGGYRCQIHMKHARQAVAEDNKRAEAKNIALLGGSSGGKPLYSPDEDGGNNNNGGGGDEDGNEEGSSLIDSYKAGWQNFGQAWSIVQNGNATFGQRLFASTYMTVWAGAHIGLAVGLSALGCAALVAGCQAALSTRPIWIQGFARGGQAWHIGLETVKNMNIVHIGNHINYGVHIAIGAVAPYVGYLHVYIEKTAPFFRIWRP